MAIKVKLTDGLIEVGGEFKGALAFVKGHEGRRYDPATKIWMVAMTLKDFIAYNRPGLPIEILSGNGSQRYQSGSHITRYGTSWGEEEWSAQKKVWSAESKIDNKYAGPSGANERQLKDDLLSIGVAERGATYLISRMWRLEDDEEFGKVQFSSPERRQQIYAAIEAYREREEAIERQRQDEIDAHAEAIWEQAGIL